jgi:hypothetical protein
MKALCPSPRDAVTTLSALRDGHLTDRRQFESVIGGAIDSLSAAAPAKRLRAYGEMVDLLWQTGDVAAAVRLESLWNDLGKTRRFSLLCA